MNVPAWVLAGMLLLTGDPGLDQQAQEQLKLGEQMLTQGKYEQAVEVFREAIRLDPTLVMGHYGLGQAHMALKQYPAAVTAFRQAREVFLQLVSVNVTKRIDIDKARDDRIRVLQDYIRELGSVTAAAGSLQAQRQQNQIQQWELEIAFLQRSPGSLGVTDVPAGLSLRLGSAHFRCGQMADAEREFRAAIAVQKKLGEAHNNLAVVLLLTGRPAEAKEEVKLAEKAGFKVPSGLAKDIDAALEQARSRPPR